MPGRPALESVPERRSDGPRDDRRSGAHRVHGLGVHRVGVHRVEVHNDRGGCGPGSSPGDGRRAPSGGGRSGDRVGFGAAAAGCRAVCRRVRSAPWPEARRRRPARAIRRGLHASRRRARAGRARLRHASRDAAGSRDVAASQATGALPPCFARARASIRAEGSPIPQSVVAAGGASVKPPGRASTPRRRCSRAAARSVSWSEEQRRAARARASKASRSP